MTGVGSSSPNGATVLHQAAAMLAAAGLDDPQREATLLLAHVTGSTPLEVTLARDQSLGAVEVERLLDLVSQRAGRIPLQHLLGAIGFHDVEIETGPAALIPRPETEILVEAVIGWARDAALARPRILDLGTGSGAIAVALAAALPSARVVATDLSSSALELAARNAARARVSERVELVRGDWLSALAQDARFDAVVANPPYVRSATIEHLEPEVRLHDPRLALDGGVDGLDAIRAIAAAAPRHLASRGLLALEIGFDQAVPVTALLRSAGFGAIAIRPDLANLPRVALARV